MKKSLKFYITLIITKLVYFLINLFSKDRGTNFPGLIALKLYKDFVKEFNINGQIIVVTGTNGKTSSSNMISEILINNNKKVINNSKGSNMLTGIISTLISNSSIKGIINADYFVFETDERDSKQIFKYIKPNYLLCTNLFRDSIKRNGHSEFVFNILNNEISKITTLILNSDDLISSRLCKGNKKVFYSLDMIKDKHIDSIVKDIIACPKCKNILNFDYIHYNHIGFAKCKYCDFKSYIGDYIGVSIDFNKSTIKIKEKNKLYDYNLLSNSIYNIYNLIGVISILRTIGISHKEIKEGLNNVKLKETRQDIIKKDNLEVISLLSKNQNPISTSLAINYIASLDGNKVVILLVTDTKDKKHGSEDISWLYDTDFEFLNKENIKQIIVCGSRAIDLKNRLILGSISENNIVIQENYLGIEKLINYKNIEKVVILYELYGYDIVSSLKKKIGSDRQ